MEHIIVQLGLFFVIASILAIIVMYLRQTTVLAYIAVGILLGIFRSKIHLEQHTIDIISEIGILLLLFLAGMELDLMSLRKQMGMTLKSGLGQIIGFTLIGAMIGIFLVDIDKVVAAIYFGLCLTFSSTIVVLKLLKDRKELESFHGQTLLGILILQDITAIFALVFLSSYGSDQSLLLSVGLILLKLAGLGIVMFLSFKFLITRIFERFAQSQELLFIGSLGYVFGVAALCDLIHFSPEIGAFLAGVTLASIPYKIEIEDKVEPIKNLGVILFFVALGFNLELDKQLIRQIPLIVILSFIVLLGTPLLMMLLGYILKLKSRPTFYMGIMLNQISEFSLIIATLCLGAGIFSKDLFTIVTFASILSILISCIGHSFIDKLYTRLKLPLKFLDEHSNRLKDLEKLDKIELKDHIILLGYNELTDYIADRLAERDLKVIILDYDPEKIKHIETHESPNHIAIYADPMDPDVWEEVKLEKASLVISGIRENHEGELAMLYYLHSLGSSTATIIYSSTYEEALEIYEQDGTLAILPEFSVAESMISTLERVHYQFHRLQEGKKERVEQLKKARSNYFIFH